MKVDRYRCPKCQTFIFAHEVEEIVRVWPQDVEPNSERYGLVSVVVRPGPLLCHSPAHPHPVGMKRESVDLDPVVQGRFGQLGKVVSREGGTRGD